MGCPALADVCVYVWYASLLCCQELDSSSDLDESTRALLKQSLSTYAVAMLTKLRCVASGDVVTIANIHVAWDKFERQDRQCLQVARVSALVLVVLATLGRCHILPSVLWHCSLGVRKSMRLVKLIDEVLCGYLYGVRCRLFAYGPADATASQNPIISCLV